MTARVYGLNCDLGRPDFRAPEMVATGARIARFPLWPTLPPSAAALLGALGLDRWGIVLPQSADWSDPQRAADELADRWAAQLSHCQVWSEPDGSGAASSTLDPAMLQHRASLLVPAFLARNPSLQVIAPGIIGRPEYLLDLDLTLYDALDAHIYGRAEDIPSYLPRFPTNLPIWVGETWADPDLLRLLARQPRVCGLVPWWHSPPDVPGLGILDNPLLRAAFRLLAGGSPMPTTPDDTSTAVWAARWKALREGAVYNHAFGLESWWRQNADTAGYPLTDAEALYAHDGGSYAGRVFSKAGLVVWRPDSGAVLVGWP